MSHDFYCNLQLKKCASSSIIKILVSGFLIKKFFLHTTECDAEKAKKGTTTKLARRVEFIKRHSKLNWFPSNDAHPTLIFTNYAKMF